jgi:hypothetical protein
MFFSPGLVLTVPRASHPIFMLEIEFLLIFSLATRLVFVPGHVFGGTEGVGFRFHVLRSRTHFRRYRGHWVPFSCFALLDSFSIVPRVSGPIFIFCSPGLVFDGTEGVVSLFHVLRSRTYFRRYRGRQVPFSCFAHPDSFSAVPRASCPFFMFCSP